MDKGETNFAEDKMNRNEFQNKFFEYIADMQERQTC